MPVLLLSPRVPPGLLTAEAWDVLRTARDVLADDLADPQVAAIRQSGVRVRRAPRPSHLDHDVVWVTTEAQDDDDLLVGSYDVPGAHVLDLVHVMDRLRRECPWTQQRTHEDLAKYLLEETYETLEAIEDGDRDHLREELGDLLMQVVFHARVAAESAGWDLDDVADGIAAKLVSRNPHVFGDVTVSSVEEIDANWEAIKATQKQRTRPDEGVPRTLPALAYADSLLGRLGDPAVTGDDLGSRLLALVAEARAAGQDAEGLLRARVRALLDAPAG